MNTIFKSNSINGKSVHSIIFKRICARAIDGGLPSHGLSQLEYGASITRLQIHNTRKQKSKWVSITLRLVIYHHNKTVISRKH